MNTPLSTRRNSVPGTRASLWSMLELPLLTAVGTWVAMFSWRGFAQQPGGFLVPVLVVGLAMAAIGGILRWWRVPSAGVVALQFVVGLALASLVVTGTLWPTHELLRDVADSFDAAQTYASPVPQNATTTVHPMLILGGALVMLLIDVVACTLGRVPLAGLPLLAVYSVPISLLGGGLSWWIFAVTALFFLLMLFVQEQQHVGRWGRALGARANSTAPGSWRPHNDAVRASATTIGAVAIVAAVVVPLAIPTLSLAVFDIGAGGGKGGDIKITNPIVDLNKDLKQGNDTPVLRIVTNEPDPGYLRISVLNRFTDDQWSSGDRSVPSSHLPDGAMPALQGVDPGIAHRDYRVDVSVDSDFESTWLPTQAPISSIQADGDWRYDSSTMDFIAGHSGLDTAGMQYTMTAVDLDFTARELDADSERANDAISDELTDYPTLSPLVTSTALRVTSKATTPFQKAVALQNYFRDHFTYSLKRPEGDGVDDLDNFLRAGSGYCQQFSAAMAAMARYLGIPARVAVGFLHPDPVPGQSNTYEYSTHDLHAWPELYFQGAGWVRFEPTPATRTDSAPSYTAESVPTGTPPSDTPTNRGAGHDADANGKPTSKPRPRLDDATPVTPPRATDGGDGGGSSVPWTVGGVVLLVVVLVVLLLWLPRLLRARRRASRLGGGPEEAWEELRATFADLRLAWPEGRSPRVTRDHVAGRFGRSGAQDPAYRPAHGARQAPEAVAALDRIVREVELGRYARDPDRGVAGALAADVTLCTDALVAGVTPGVRRRAAWLPWSVVSLRRDRRRAGGLAGGRGGSPSATEPFDATAADPAANRVVEHI